jgi:hypothetical protein
VEKRGGKLAGWQYIVPEFVLTEYERVWARKKVSSRFYKTCKMLVEEFHQPKGKLLGYVGDEIQELKGMKELKKESQDDRLSE